MIHPPHPLHLRSLDLSDLPAVIAIEQQSFPSPTQEKTYRYELSENQLAHYQALTLLRAGGNEQLLGYAGYWLIADEIHMIIIAIDPQRRGCGLGELLLLNMLNLAYDQQAALVTLEVRDSNRVAQELYQKYGFELVGRRKQYYKDTGEDALLMTILLQSNTPYRHFLDQRQKQLYARLESASF